MSPLTKKQQSYRILYLGISFLVMFTSYDSLQNIMSKLYDENGCKNLGQTALMFLYGVFGISVVFSPFVVKKLGFKKSMFYSSLGYAVFQATGFIVIADVQVSRGVVWVVVILGSILCGVCAGVLWVAQGAYTSAVADKDNQTELFGVFWALTMSSQITGNLLITFILGKMSNFVYFLLLTILGFLSSILFLFLPNVSNASVQAQKQQTTTFKEQVSKVWQLISNKKYIHLNMYFWFPGLTIAFYVGFLYKLVIESMVQNSGESESDYNHRVNFYEGFVFIVLGISQLITGIMMRFVQKVCTLKLAFVGTLIVLISCLVSFICYSCQSLPLCFMCAILWGTSQTFLQTNIGVMISKIYPSQVVEGFSTYRVFFTIGVVSMLLVSIVLSPFSSYIFLTLILIITIVIIRVSLTLKNLHLELGDVGGNQLGTELINYKVKEDISQKLKDTRDVGIGIKNNL